MYISMECKQSYWEDTKPSVNIENNSYHGSKDGESRKNDNVSPPIQPSIHDKICKEENSIYQYCDRNFNFSANIAGGVTSEEDDYHHGSPKRKIAVTRDPMSHRIIEKRRRDRMNNCLADLSRLIPAEYLKKGRGRIEKTEIIEMAIKHMKFLQAHTCDGKTGNCESKTDNGHQVNAIRAEEPQAALQQQYKFGYQDCLAETMHFLIEMEGFYPSDTLCVKMMSHLQKYYENITAQVDKPVYFSQMETTPLPNPFQPKMNSYQTGDFEDANKRSRRNSVIPIASSDDNSSIEPINGTSQLREMLVGPHLNSFYPPSTLRPNIILHSSPEQSPSSSESTHADSISSSSHSLFKFKNYIKERFSAECSNLHYSSSASQTPSTASSVVAYTNREKCKTEFLDERHRPITPPDEHRQIHRMDDHYAGSIVSKSVPVFALHSKGAFYIPLSIDSTLLTPFLAELNNDYGINGFPPSTVLHPVTISVNFCRPLASKSNECKASVSPAIGHHSTTPLHIVPECR